MIRNFFISSFILFQLFTLSLWLFAKEDIYEKGLKYQEEGDWQKALDVWAIARDSLAKLNQSDPRIGIAFIELVTKQKARDFYQKANDMYFWGFSGENIKKFQEEIKKEFARLAPITSEQSLKEWMKTIQKYPDEAYSILRKFWLEKDPNPVTTINERLLEHWERINFARKKFTIKPTTPYGTDDRGLVYVKYGEPQSVYTGKLGVDQVELMQWISDFAIRQEIERYNTLPAYEIWIYNTLQKEQTTVFLFGKKLGMSNFGLRAGIEEFIPSRAFSRSSASRETRGLVPGYMLQLQYYRELIGLDPYFMNRYRELEELWRNARAVGRFFPRYEILRGLRSHYQNLDKDRIKFRHLPVDQSIYEFKFTPMSLASRQIRILDKQNNPQLVIITAAELTSEMIEKSISYFKKRTPSKVFSVKHKLLKFNEKWEETGRESIAPGEFARNSSVFTIPYSEKQNLVLVVERTIRKKEPPDSVVTSKDSSTVVSIGKIVIEGPPPLNHNPEVLEVSDILLGVKRLPIINEIYSYPFPIIPVDGAEREKPLHAYLEIYHLPVKETGKTNFTIKYAIAKINKKGKVEKFKHEKVLKSESRVQNQNFQFTIDISKLKPDNYALKVEVQVENSLQKVIRQTYFRVI